MAATARPATARPRRSDRRFVSPAIRALARRRAAELTGLALGLAGLMLLVALASYDARDPSLDTASMARAHNLAGPVGATVADLLLQAFGLAGGLPGIAMLCLAWRFASRRGVGSRGARGRPAARRAGARGRAVAAAAAPDGDLARLGGPGRGSRHAAGPGRADGWTRRARLGRGRAGRRDRLGAGADLGAARLWPDRRGVAGRHAGRPAPWCGSRSPPAGSPRC